MKHYTESVNAVLKATGSSQEGLTSKEAERRLAQNGKNKLAEPEKDSLLKKLLAQMADPMIIILIAAAAISIVTSLMQGEPIFDAIIILAVVVVNAVLGVYQENKAEHAIEALRRCRRPQAGSCGTATLRPSAARTWWWATSFSWRPAMRSRRTGA